jgi:FAD/FMN-containing dehydrogenase
VVGALARIVGGEHVLGGDADDYAYDVSRSMGLAGRADAVVRPGTPEEVAAVVAWCYEHEVGIVPRGGGTGVAGGATPVDGGVVLSLERLRHVRAFDPLLWRIHVDAGVTTATVQRLAREHGLAFPVDPGAAEQSHIGGNVATNAGGPHCFKYGVMRSWVTGLEAVLAPGELVSVGGPARKDVAGYDLVGLLCGSEGTLGVVTGVWLRLMPAPAVALPVCSFSANASVGQEALERVLASGVVPAAVEFFDRGALRAARGAFPTPVPADAGFLLVAEADGSECERDELLEALGPGAFSPEPASLWRWRDGVAHAIIAQRGGVISDDIAVPVDRLAEAVEATATIGRRHDLDACSFGHAGDGNVHATFLIGDAGERARAERALEDVFALAVELGGTISGEHGLGWLKRGRLRSQWAPAAVAAHRAIKDALDPKGLLNPGKKAP